MKLSNLMSMCPVATSDGSGDVSASEKCQITVSLASLLNKRSDIHHVSQSLIIMAKCFAILALLCLISVTRAEISSDGLMFAEKMAFVLCDSDKMFGLTWHEVEMCEERFADMLAKEDIDVPSREDFDSADLNGDGTLVMEEWKKWISSDE